MMTTTTAMDIAKVAARLPDLGRYGFHRDVPLPIDAEFMAQVDAARAFILDTPTPRVTIAGRGAYILKHKAERHGRKYVSVGALIAGAVLEGLACVRSSVVDSPNRRFVEG